MDGTGFEAVVSRRGCSLAASAELEAKSRLVDDWLGKLDVGIAGLEAWVSR